MNCTTEQEPLSSSSSIDCSEGKTRCPTSYQGSPPLSLLSPQVDGPLIGSLSSGIVIDAECCNVLMPRQSATSVPDDVACHERMKKAQTVRWREEERRFFHNPEYSECRVILLLQEAFRSSYAHLMATRDRGELSPEDFAQRRAELKESLTAIKCEYRRTLKRFSDKGAPPSEIASLASKAVNGVASVFPWTSSGFFMPLQENIRFDFARRSNGCQVRLANDTQERPTCGGGRACSGDSCTHSSLTPISIPSQQAQHCCFDVSSPLSETPRSPCEGPAMTFNFQLTLTKEEGLKIGDQLVDPSPIPSSAGYCPSSLRPVDETLFSTVFDSPCRGSPSHIPPLSVGGPVRVEELRLFDKKLLICNEWAFLSRSLASTNFIATRRQAIATSSRIARLKAMCGGESEMCLPELKSPSQKLLGSLSAGKSSPNTDLSAPKQSQSFPVSRQNSISIPLSDSLEDFGGLSSVTSVQSAPCSTLVLGDCAPCAHQALLAQPQEQQQLQQCAQVASQPTAGRCYPPTIYEQIDSAFACPPNALQLVPAKPTPVGTHSHQKLQEQQHLRKLRAFHVEPPHTEMPFIQNGQQHLQQQHQHHSAQPHSLPSMPQPTMAPAQFIPQSSYTKVSPCQTPQQAMHQGQQLLTHMPFGSQCSLFHLAAAFTPAQAINPQQFQRQPVPPVQRQMYVRQPRHLLPANANAATRYQAAVSDPTQLISIEEFNLLKQLW